MQTEIEAKWLDIEPAKIREKLKSLGAKLIQPERLMKRKVFDYSDRRLQAEGGWVRVRDEGNKVTLSYKQLSDRTLHGTKEVSVVVDSFEKTCDFLTSVGLAPYSYQETKRESWAFNNSEIEIDTWPWIPSFVEIEAKTKNELKKAATALGLDWQKAMHGSVETAYQAYYDVTEEEIDSWEEITFTPVPAELGQKRK